MSTEQAFFLSQQIRGHYASDCPPSIMFSDSRRLTIPRMDGYVETRLRRIEGTEIAFGQVRSSGHSIHLQEVDRLTILMPRQGRLKVRTGSATHDLSPVRPMAFRPGERSTDAIVGPSGLFVGTMLQLSAGRLKDLADQAQLPVQNVLGLDALDLRGPAFTAFLHGTKRLADDIFLLPEAPLPPRVAAEASNFIYEQVLAVLDGLAPPSQPNILRAFHLVRSAEEIMHDPSDEPLSMIDLAQRLGCSLRSLQLAFREVHDGSSPRQVYTQIRLQRARRRLLDASERDQVTRIALEAGFLHLSRFAQTYARAFGELPSQTLARRRS